MFMQTRTCVLAAVALAGALLSGGGVRADDPNESDPNKYSPVGYWIGYYAYDGKDDDHHHTYLRLEGDSVKKTITGGRWEKDYPLKNVEDEGSVIRWDHDVDGRYYKVSATWEQHTGIPDTIYFTYKVYPSVDGKPDMSRLLYGAHGQLDYVKDKPKDKP